LTDSIKQGGTLKRKQNKEICKIEPQKAGKIHDFFSASGWISKT